MYVCNTYTPLKHLCYFPAVFIGDADAGGTGAAGLAAWAGAAGGGGGREGGGGVAGTAGVGRGVDGVENPARDEEEDDEARRRRRRRMSDVDTQIKSLNRVFNAQAFFGAAFFFLYIYIYIHTHIQKPSSDITLEFCCFLCCVYTHTHTHTYTHTGSYELRDARERGESPENP
jgi:hypothetical protein